MITHTVDPAARNGAAPHRPAVEGAGELFQSLLCRLPRHDSDAGPALRTLGLTSCSGGEGVSTVAARLAAEASRNGRGPVVLVDANLARPAVHKLLGVKGGPGLAEALKEEAALEDILQVTPLPHLSVVAAGGGASGERREARGEGLCSSAWAVSPGSSALIPGLSGLLEKLKEEFALIVLDVPPLSPASSWAGGLAGAVDGLVLVVEAERTRLAALRQTKDWLEGRARFLGVILNKRREYTPEWLQRLL